jgi:hypothetical protein
VSLRLHRATKGPASIKITGAFPREQHFSDLSAGIDGEVAGSVDPASDSFLHQIVRANLGAHASSAAMLQHLYRLAKESGFRGSFLAREALDSGRQSRVDS